MKKKNIFIFIIISLLFVLPMLITQSANDDFLTHVSRLYNLSLSFKNGNFNPYMYETCYNNFGYPFGIFYPDTFLKPFSFLCYLGIPEYYCMIIMLFVINFFTLFVPYYLFSKCKINKANIISIIYFLYPYRFWDYYKRCSLGELLAFIFIPLIIYGIYKIFKENKNSFTLFLGMWGLIHSHILSVFMTTIILIIFYTCNIKQIKNELNILKYTIINAIITLATSIDVILPILEAQIIENLRYESDTSFMGTLNENAIYIINPNNLLYTIVFIILIMCVYFLFKNKNMLIKQTLLLTILCIISTNLFNWNIIIKIIPFLNIIQFPWRFLIFASIPFTYLIYMLNKKFPIKNFIIIFLLLSELLFSVGLSYVYYKYDFEIMSSNIGAGDYLNDEVDTNNLSFFKHIDELKEKNVVITNNGYIPMFYYHNYKIIDNKKTYSYENKNGLIFIPELENKNIEVYIIYQNTIIQNFSYIISIISWVIFILYFLYNLNMKVKEI